MVSIGELVAEWKATHHCTAPVRFATLSPGLVAIRASEFASQRFSRKATELDSLG